MADWFHLDPVTVLDAPREQWLIRVAAFEVAVERHNAAHRPHDDR